MQPPTTNPPLPTSTKSTARTLRANGNVAGNGLWYHLRAGRLAGHKFRRQHPIPPYVADFYCARARLVVEVDGSQHCDAADRERTASLERTGIAVLRFWDNEVLAQTDSVLEAILVAIDRRLVCASPEPSPPAPLPVGEGRPAEAGDA